jgi:hypothetical protein
MIDREKHIAARRKELAKLTKQIERLIIRGKKIGEKKYKTPAGQIRNLGRVIAIVAHINSIVFRAHVIMSQPIPKKKFAPGAAMVAERGPEMVMMPGGIQTCAVDPMVHIPIQNKKND